MPGNFLIGTTGRFVPINKLIMRTQPSNYRTTFRNMRGRKLEKKLRNYEAKHVLEPQIAQRNADNFDFTLKPRCW